MGNKIRVELSHGGGRTAKYAGDPGACFKCGQLGHWARSEFSLITSALWAHPFPENVRATLGCESFHQIFT